MPVLSVLEGALASGMSMHGIDRMYLGMHTKSLSKWLVDWILEWEDASSQSWAVGEMPLGSFF